MTDTPKHAKHAAGKPGRGRHASNPAPDAGSTQAFSAKSRREAFEETAFELGPLEPLKEASPKPAVPDEPKPAHDTAEHKDELALDTVEHEDELALGGAPAVRPDVIPERPSRLLRMKDFAENVHPYNPPERLYTDCRSEGVNRLNGRPLSRPFHLTRGPIIAALAAAAVAAGLGGWFLVNTVDDVVNAEANMQKAIEESLMSEFSYDIPLLTQLMGSDDETLLATFAQNGFTVINLKELGIRGQNDSLDVLKLPTGMDESTGLTLGAALYTGTGSAADAVELLNGSWEFIVDRGAATDLNVRYADFTSGSVEAAVTAAVTQQGLDGTATTELGTDSVGNTVISGSVDMGGTIYTWQVSACALSDVYGFAGMPTDAVYVGIRMTS